MFFHIIVYIIKIMSPIPIGFFYIIKIMLYRITKKQKEKNRVENYAVKGMDEVLRKR